MTRPDKRYQDLGRQSQWWSSTSQEAGMSTQTTNDFAGKVAIVTGAASGIGRASVELFHARGASVIAEDRDPEVNTLARPGIVPLVADVTEESAAQRAVAAAVEQFGKLDILVN